MTRKNKMKKSLLLSFCLIFVLSNSLAQTKKNAPPKQSSSHGWVLVFTTDGELYFIREKRIRTKQNTIKAWFYSKPKPNTPEARYRSKTLFLHEYNCEQQLMRVKIIINYDVSGKATGIVSDNDNTDWDEVVPETLFEGLLLAACKQ